MTIKLQQWRTLVLPFLPAVLIGALVLVLTDIWLMQPETKDPRSDLLPELPLRQRTIPATQNESLQQLLGQFSPIPTEIESDVPSEPGMSAEAQSQQHGLLKELYIGSSVYRLMAIGQQGGSFQAVLHVRPVDGKGVPKRLTLVLGERLDDYQVTALTSRRLTLQHQQRIVFLELFIPATLVHRVTEQTELNQQ